jgi:hypothetical protein
MPTVADLIADLPMTAATTLASAVLGGATLDTIEAEVIRDVVADPSDADAANDEREAKLLVERGDAPGLALLFEQVLEDLDPSWNEIARSFAERCESGDASPDLAAVAVLLTAASADWREVAARASKLGTTDRHGRLAMAAAATKLGGEEAITFLRVEADRFIAALGESATDTAAFALVSLLRRRDAATIAKLAAALRTKAPNPAAGRALIDLMGSDPAFAATVEALVASGFRGDGARR